MQNVLRKTSYNWRAPLFFYCLLFCSSTYAIDNPHFYRAPYLWPEPRLEKNWLFSWDMSFGGGTTSKGRNEIGKTTCLLAIYGPENAKNVGAGVPNLDPANPFEKILIDLAALPDNGTFGQLEFCGKFHLVESMINVYQNLVHGFFLHAHLPLRSLKINQITHRDLSPDDGPMPNKTNQTWQTFLQQFTTILAQQHISLKGAHQIGTGDFSVLAGWTFNYQDTIEWDYIDVTSQWGILFPTGKKKNEGQPFDLPLGYNGFFGIPLKFDCAAGIYEWLTLGAHVGALFFLKKDKTIAVQTALNQNGFIKLAQTKACVDQGTIWEVSAYIKADHFVKGASLQIGYSFHTQDRTTIEPQDPALFDPLIVNNDSQYGSWRMHTLHFLFEYDFARQRNCHLPRLGCWFNYVITGKRIFSTHVSAPYIGVDVAWCF